MIAKIIAILKFFLPDASVDRAVANLTKGMKMLDKVIEGADSVMDKAIADMEAAQTAHGAAEAKKEQAARIKAKIADLIA